eukprot:g49836.t1
MSLGASKSALNSKQQEEIETEIRQHVVQTPSPDRRNSCWCCCCCRPLWFSRHLYMIQVPFLLSVYAVMTIALLAIPVTAIVDHDLIADQDLITTTFFKEGYPCDEPNKSFYIPLFSPFIFLFGVVAFLLRANGISSTDISLQYPCSRACLNIFEKQISEHVKFSLSTLVLLLYIPVISHLGTTYPLWLSYKMQLETSSYDSLKDVPKNICDFYQVIASPYGFLLFKRYLSGVFSVESLLFFQAVEDFRETALLTLTYHCFGEASKWRFETSTMEGSTHPYEKFLVLKCNEK